MKITPNIIIGFVANRISIFLLVNSKGFREHTDKEKFYEENKNRYNHILLEHSHLYKKLLKAALGSPYQYFSEINNTVYKFDFLKD